jgi:hypothetical protein
VNDLINFTHDNKPKIALSPLCIGWHWDIDNDIPEAGSRLYVVVEINHGGGINEYRLFKNAELFIDEENEEDVHTVWLDEDNFNLLNADEEHTTKPIRQIFAWAYLPDDADIFPMSAMDTILQKKRWNNA